MRPQRPEADAVPLELVLITGMSGSGKSVALRALEDAGYFCVDNLPPELLISFVDLEQGRGQRRVAIAMDVRSATSLPQVPAQLRELAQRGEEESLVDTTVEDRDAHLHALRDHLAPLHVDFVGELAGRQVNGHALVSSVSFA